MIVRVTHSLSEWRGVPPVQLRQVMRESLRKLNYNSAVVRYPGTDLVCVKQDSRQTTVGEQRPSSVITHSGVLSTMTAWQWRLSLSRDDRMNAWSSAVFYSSAKWVVYIRSLRWLSCTQYLDNTAVNHGWFRRMTLSWTESKRISGIRQEKYGDGEGLPWAIHVMYRYRTCHFGRPIIILSLTWCDLKHSPFSMQTPPLRQAACHTQHRTCMEYTIILMESWYNDGIQL